MHTEAEEAEEGFLENDGGEGESEVGQNGGEDLGEDLAKKDGGGGLADQTGGQDKGALFDGENLGADDSGQRQPLDQPEAHKKKHEACVWGEWGQPGAIEQPLEFQIEKSDENDDQNDAGQSVENVDQTHHGVIGASTEIAGDEAVGDPDEE